MYKFDFQAITPSRKVKINGMITQFNPKELLDYENYANNKIRCERGCPNYNHKWSCPPYSPNYRNYAKGYEHGIMLLFWCNLEQFNYIKNPYMKIKAANAILKSRIDNFLRKLEDKLSGKMLSNGSCKLCKPCNCKKGLICKHPKKMRYSMEALGLDVEEISKKYFSHELLWYKNKTVPVHSSVISCLLMKNEISESEFINLTNNIENSNI